jgi:3,4-dihydroxy 2-butanone 4-phosphate synthase/GTP cyclohydrolase II
MITKDDSYTETKLTTKFGTFNLRVYADVEGKETVVVSTTELDVAKPVLTRLHSECLTGDTFGSLHCDCGEQLTKSLQLIHESKNGVLVYLRQEGRGIGLFNKIKAYRLQSQGHDTFDANLMLGRKPDERTYEKAKLALVDLAITHVRLLTNNPSKVLELEHLGFVVTERVPLLIQPNEFNAKYFATKRDKFKHLIEGIFD